MSRAGNALKHGLTSRLKREAQSEEARELAAALIESAPPTSTLRAAALELAEALIHHRDVNAHRSHLWNEMTSPPEPTELEARRARVHAAARKLLAAEGLADPLEGRDPPPPTTAENFMLMTAEQLTQLRRIETLVRKALSRRTKTIRRFDYEFLEARRGAEKSKPPAAAAPRPKSANASEGERKTPAETLDGSAAVASAGCRVGLAEEAPEAPRELPAQPEATPQNKAVSRVCDTDALAADPPSAAHRIEPAAAEPPPPHVEAPPATMAEFIARGDHGPRGRWMEPRWTDDIKAALRPPPLEDGESFTHYLQILTCHTDPHKLSRLREWQVHQDLTDGRWREVRREGRSREPNMQIFEQP